jgi:hypothetical protein
MAMNLSVRRGESRYDAACQDGMDSQRLSEWVHRYNEVCVDGLLSRHARGPAPKLTEAQMADLRELVAAGPNPAIHKVVQWLCIDLRTEVSRRFSFTVDEGSIGKWLATPCSGGRVLAAAGV